MIFYVCDSAKFARRLYYNKQNGQRFYCRMPLHTFC